MSDSLNRLPEHNIEAGQAFLHNSDPNTGKGMGTGTEQSLMQVVDVERGDDVDLLYRWSSRGPAGCSSRSTLLVPTGWAIPCRCALLYFYPCSFQYQNSSFQECWTLPL